MKDIITSLQKTVEEKLGKKISKADLEVIVKAFFKEVTLALKDGKELNVAGFGKFSTIYKEAHDGKNPKTGEVVKVEAKSQPKFKYSSVVKKIIIE